MKEKDEWAVIKNGAFLHLQGSNKIIFKKHVAKIIQKVSGGELTRIALEKQEKTS